MALRSLLFVAIVAGMTLVYQNCGNVKMQSQNSNPSEPELDGPSYSKTGKIAVFTPENAGTPPPRLIIREEIEPIAIEFGSTTSLDLFSFRLDIASGRVVRKSTGAVVYRFRPEDYAELAAILEGTILIEWTDLIPGGQNLACTMDYSYGYAMLITKDDEHRLGSGSSSCPFDLFKISLKAKAGLQPFLAKLASRIP